ncbi:MAG: chemotaxis protein CheA [Spirochaetaceae bacterium]|nr:chemotaxis protein CheA [Spirochaetaceae bacterium]
MSDYLDLNNEELLKDFFSEAEQQVENLESNILVIENDPTNHDAIDEIFRAAHTLKGGSATVEMNELSGFTHAVEDLLDELRSGTIPVTEPVVDALLSAIDIIKAMLEARQNGSIYEDDVEPMKATLRAFVPQKEGKKKAVAPKQFAPSTVRQASQPAPKAAAPAPAPAASNLPPLSEYEYLELKDSCQAGEKLWAVTVTFDESNPMNSVGGIQVFAALKNKGTVLKTVPDFDVLYEDVFQPEVVYYVAAKCGQDELEDASFLTDVTLSTDARCLDSGYAAQAAEPAPQAVAPSAPAAPVAQAAPVAAAPAEEAPKAEAASEAPQKGAQHQDNSKHTSSSSVLRVDSRRIDYLLNLVSETVITKAAFNQSALQVGELQSQLLAIEAGYREKLKKLFDQVPRYIESSQEGMSLKDIKASLNNDFGELYNVFDTFDASFKNMVGKFRSSTQNLGRIAGELQEGVMKIRMVPISQIFSRFPRVVRDLSRDLNKKINLQIEGDDTELDKAIIEDLLDPIMHCVRNSVDHGIESPEERKAAGKDEEGTVLLKASNEGNLIIIDIIDDGKGIDVSKIKKKAVERGLIHPDKALTDQEAYQLMFSPGFSTADKITNVSGRGVGLDVVKTQIEKLNGSVIVTSQPGYGSKFSIHIPLTMAIIQGLLVRVGSEVYSIPIASVIESVRVSSKEINRIDNYEVMNVRNEVISILRLSRLFGIKKTEESEYNFIVIVGSVDKKIGVMVDSLIGEEDVVIKPLRDQFTNSPGIAGASILGDGSVSLIIDVSQLLELGVRQEIDARSEQEAEIL